ncbi:DMT family transporter [Qingshengfaniella alkalisoli]|uniref:DMT family transporter n=1 Tax=Qingshengfaniella alkalisoli TaxID=2599296 RepID=A0A5B8J6X3_9RHOB|nr:DMT family transporter [Qingshengfaniella alkalisoli]QDY70197.1 DMT family transporter [Qingshengfaniella alkalisoli]
MRLLPLLMVTMVAFAANSVLNRMAIDMAGSGPVTFAAIRILSGALFLALLAIPRPRANLSRLPWLNALGLGIYMLGFSFAYIELDAGAGALILFGTIQAAMLLISIALGEKLPVTRWVGAGISLAGLVWLLWPQGGAQISLAHATCMIAAALGWSLYTFKGRTAQDPLTTTALSFLLLVPLAVIMLALGNDGATRTGVLLAITSGAITSGLGYALWYYLLARIPFSVAAVAQLSVPVIAIAGGLTFLGEAISLQFVLATFIVLTGVAMAIPGKRKPR